MFKKFLNVLVTTFMLMYYSPQDEFKLKEEVIKIIFGLSTYLLFFILNFFSSFDKVSFEADWPLRQSNSMLNMFFEDENNLIVSKYLTNESFGLFITSYDLIMIWIGCYTTIYMGVQYIRNVKCKILMIIFTLIKDFINLILIIFQTDFSIFKPGFTNFLLFSLKTFYNEKLITININITFKLFCLIILLEDKISKFSIKILKFFKYSSIIYLSLTTITLTPYIFIGILFILPIYLLWYIASTSITRFIILPIEFFIECLFKYKSKRKEIEYINPYCHPQARAYLINSNERELEGMNMFYLGYFIVKVTEILIYFSLFFSLLLLNGFNIFSIFYMYFSIPFMSFNLYTIQYTEFLNRIQNWKTQFLTYF